MLMEKSLCKTISDIKHLIQCIIHRPPQSLTKRISKGCPSTGGKALNTQCDESRYWFFKMTHTEAYKLNFWLKK